MLPQSSQSPKAHAVEPLFQVFTPRRKEDVASYLVLLRLEPDVAVDPPGDDRRGLRARRSALYLVLALRGHRFAVPEQLGHQRAHCKKEKYRFDQQKLSS